MVQLEKRVAVLLAAYNGKLWIEQQVDTILMQKGVSVSLYISLDLSKDDSLVYCESLQHKYPNVVLLPYGERFGSAGANFFRLIRDVDFSSFDFVAFSDQDDIWDDCKLSSAIRLLESASADAYSSNVTAFWPNGKSWVINKAQPQRQWDFLFEAAGPGCTYVLSAPLASKIQSLVRSRYSEFKGIYLHDWFMYAYARANGYKWVIDSVPYMSYRQHGENEVGVNRGFKAFKHRYRKIMGELGLHQSKRLAELSGIDSHPFVKRWSGMSRMGIMRLALCANQCRRKPVDRVAFFLMCVMLAIK